MLLRTRLLRAVSGDCGPASKNVLRGIAKARGELPRFASTLRGLLDAGELVVYGARKNAMYGLPGRRPARKAK